MVENSNQQNFGDNFGGDTGHSVDFGQQNSAGSTSAYTGPTTPSHSQSYTYYSTVGPTTPSHSQSYGYYSTVQTPGHTSVSPSHGYSQGHTTSTGPSVIPTPQTQQPPIPPGYNTFSPLAVHHSIPKFSGYMHEDAMKFIHEFTSYLLLANVDTNSPQAIAAFHLNLQGPALVWFQGLDALTMSTWDRIKTAFYDQFCSVECNTPQRLAEEAAYQNLKLSPTQLIEDYHAVIVMKGRRLGKTEADMVSKFVNGLPDNLAYFVRAGNNGTLTAALNAAKLGESYGYRSHAATASVNMISVAPNHEVHAIRELTDRIEQLEVSAMRTKNVPQQSQRPQRSCYRCGGLGHVQRRCNWTGNGPKLTTAKCQFCLQFGHEANQCTQVTMKSRTGSAVVCQLCKEKGHDAQSCPTLN